MFTVVKIMYRYGAFMIVAVMLASCSSSLDHLQNKADTLAGHIGMRKVKVPAGPFTLLVYERMGSVTEPVHIYIEGDGNAWLNMSTVSPDSTPTDPVALKLAAADNAPNVVYLSRVCQYIKSPSCEPKYWTSAQFSEEVMAAYNDATNRWKGYKLELTGYSGGAAVALLLAARRDDVVAIRTVAGNVDTEAFTNLHKVTPFSESLLPTDVLVRTSRIPQRHFVGQNDKVIPPFIASGYQDRMMPGHCSAYNVVPGLDHYSGWPQVWHVLQSQPLPCALQP